jgi:hypothetical protein
MWSSSLCAPEGSEQITKSACSTGAIDASSISLSDAAQAARVVAISVDRRSLSTVENDAGSEQLQSASISVCRVESLDERSRIVVVEERRSDAIEALRNDVAAALAPCCEGDRVSRRSLGLS